MNSYSAPFMRRRLSAMLLLALLSFSLFQVSTSANAVQATPTVQWFTPRIVPLGNTTFIVNGTNFVNGAVVKLEGVAMPTTFLSSTQLKVASNFTDSGSGNLTVTNPGTATSSPRLLEWGRGISVSITPETATVAPGAKQQFTAIVSATSNKQVYWYVNGGSANGTISSNGLYTAPNVAPASPVTIRAVSAANSERQGTATVTISGSAQTVSVSIAPVSPTVQVNTTRQFSATVTGTANTAVTWQVNNVTGGNATTGTITNSGLFTAPAAVPSGFVIVRAISQADPTKSGSTTVTIAPPANAIAVSVSPTSASLATNATQQFTASVTGTANTAVTWQVNNVTGGNSTTGTITNTGLYTAPAAVPASSVTVRAVSQADATKSGNATVTITAPAIAVTISPTTVSLAVLATQQFSASVTGTANTAVTWHVNNTTGGNSTVGTVSAAGLYTAPAAIPAGTITVTAVSQADNTKKANATVSIIDGSAITVGRLLEQSTFGPTAQLTARVKQIGIPAFLDEQFNTPESPIPNFTAQQNAELTAQFYNNLLMGQDQLRQRVIYALSEIIVISRNKNNYANEISPWLQILSRNAFGNYKTLLKEITLDATMGKYLDMVNSTKPGASGGANENYPREVMQLFSIGLYLLNPDGSNVLDANGKPIPTYTQTDIRQLALALTGWTYNTQNGPPQSPNPNYYPGQMVPLPAYHDTSSKTFLGQTLPANQTMQKDVDDAINIIFNHPNVAPFVCSRLIKALVTSNPSSAYVARISAVFNKNGAGVRGDLKAVIRAILLDAEARNDNPPADFGRLRTPLQHHLALFRVLGGTITQPNQITYVYDNMGESFMQSPSVFGHYSPSFRIPKQAPPLFGPEFQIHGPGELVNVGNFLWNYMNYYQTGIWDLQWLFSLGSNHAACINAVNNLLLYGRMSSGMRQSLMTALQEQAAVGADAKMRALTVLYITAMSSEYLVVR